jgi:hypothetical protein
VTAALDILITASALSDCPRKIATETAAPAAHCKSARRKSKAECSAMSRLWLRPRRRKLFRYPVDLSEVCSSAIVEAFY